MPLPADYKIAGIEGTGGFSDSNYWDSNADVEPEGSTTMSRIFIFSSIRRLITSGWPFGKRAANGGWLFRWVAGYRFRIYDGGGINRETTLIPTIVPKEGECIVWIGSYDETELVCYAKGESTITGPWVGYSQCNSDVEIGRVGTTESPDFIILACLATDTYALSVAECATAEASIIDDLEQGRYIRTDQLPGSGWNWYWDARDCNIAIPGQWIDRISNVVLNEVGQTQRFGVSPRF